MLKSVELDSSERRNTRGAVLRCNQPFKTDRLTRGVQNLIMKIGNQSSKEGLPDAIKTIVANPLV